MNNIIQSPVPGTRDGNWIWDGTRWVCEPDCDGQPDFPHFRPPPPWFPPPATSPPWYPGGNAGVSFSPPGSPPPNPIRGNFWWDGKTLWMFDGAAWVPTGGSGSAGTTPPSSTAPANPVPGQQWFNGTTLFVWDGNAWVPVSQTKTYVQATAPPAPNPGDLWYDGTQLRIWSGSAWMVVGPGATVGPVPTTTEVFRLVQPTTVAGTGATILSWTAMPQVDTQGMYDPVTKKIQPKVAGIYAFYLLSYFGGAGNTNGAFYLLKNDSGTGDVSTNYVVALAGIGVTPDTEGIYLNSNGMVQMNGTTDFLRAFGGTNAQGLWYPANPNVPAIQGFLLP